MKKRSISSKINLQRFIKMIEGYSFNDKLIAAAISPFSENNIKLPSSNSEPNSSETMMGFMFIIAGEVKLSIDYVTYTFSFPSTGQWDYLQFVHDFY